MSNTNLTNMNPGLEHRRQKGTHTFIFWFEGGAREFAAFLHRIGVKFHWTLNLAKGQNEITPLI